MASQRLPESAEATAMGTVATSLAEPPRLPAIMRPGWSAGVREIRIGGSCQNHPVDGRRNDKLPTARRATEVGVAVRVLNRMLDLGRPKSIRIR